MEEIAMMQKAVFKDEALIKRIANKQRCIVCAISIAIMNGTLVCSEPIAARGPSGMRSHLAQSSSRLLLSAQ